MTIPLPQMSELVHAGHAARLFDGDPVSPARYHGQWWIAPADGTAYRPAGSRISALLDRAAQRLAAANATRVRPGQG